MSEVKDQAIKLFGKTIRCESSENSELESSTATMSHDNKKASEEELSETRRDGISSHRNAEDTKDSSSSSRINDDSKATDNAKETSSANTSRTEEPSEASNKDEKPPKPDKILPCPRCNSMDTKFCYYNNYNINQPRHFCKHCQRYWTAGGTMRNMPIGSGRRKSKSTASASHPRPLCESMASALSLVDQSQNSVQNVYQQNGFCQSTVSSSSASQITSNRGHDNFQGFPCYPPPTWQPYPMNSPQYRTPLILPKPTAFGHPDYPVSFYPTPQYWGCAIQNPWTMPCPTPQSSSQSSPLGKHSRDGSALTLSSSNSRKEKFSQEKHSQRPVLVPKTLRIGDANNSVGSSIWSALGIENESGESLFKAFHPKGDDKGQLLGKSQALQANPAAMSRSINFRESS